MNRQTKMLRLKSILMLLVFVCVTSTGADAQTVKKAPTFFNLLKKKKQKKNVPVITKTATDATKKNSISAAPVKVGGNVPVKGKNPGTMASNSAVSQMSDNHVGANGNEMDEKDMHGQCGMHTFFTEREKEDGGPHIAMASGTSPSYFPGTFTPFNYHPPSDYGGGTPGEVMNCIGKIELYFEDVHTGTGKGFDDGTAVSSSIGTTLGEVRRATFCKVIEDLDATFDFSLLGGAGTLKIYVEQSLAPGTSHTAGCDGWVARAVPNFYDAGSTAVGITSGYVQEYVTTGGSSAWPDEYHGLITVNFDHTGCPSAAINWQDDYLNYSNCKSDLYSTLLHEMGHVMGWFSFVQVSTTNSSTTCSGCVPASLPPVYNVFAPMPGKSPDLFTGLDVSMHGAAGTAPTSLVPLITVGGTPSINTAALDANNNYWINNLGAPDNYPVFSGGSVGFSGSFLHHLDDQTLTYSYRERISPGDKQEYVMAPATKEGEYHRAFSKGEIQTFTGVLGYLLTGTYTGTNPYTETNHLPYSAKMGALALAPATYRDFTETDPIDYSMTNDVSSSLTIDLSDAVFTSEMSDVDGDPIVIDETTIVNISGCGDGTTSNNHGALSWTGPDPTTITYTPRADFYGRARIGFNISDGKERGSFRVVTIDVARGTNVTCAPGGNMVCNGNFEEGSELSTVTDETKPYYYMDLNGTEIGKWQGKVLSDSHPYAFHANENFGFGGLISGSCVKQSLINCTGATVTGLRGAYLCSMGFVGSSVTHTNPASGNRYQSFLGVGDSHYYLKTDLVGCNQYTIEFDIANAAAGCSTCNTVDLVLSFKDDVSPTAAYNQVLPAHTFTYVASSSYPWTHVSYTFWYCGDPSNIMRISNPNGTKFVLDNLSLKQVLTPPTLGVSVSASLIGGCQKQLTSTVTDLGCGPAVYTWTGPNLSCTDCANPVVTLATAATYYLTVTDACGIRTASTSIDVTEVPPPAITGLSTVCVGQTITLSNTMSGGSWSSSNTDKATVNSSGVVTGVAAGTVTMTYLMSSTGCYVTKEVNVDPAVSAIGGNVPVCEGSDITLTNATSGGTWSSSNTSVATIVSTTGVLTGVWAGTSVVTYFVSSGCYATAVVVVNTTPVAISGVSDVCEGATITLTDATSGGTWSSSNTSVATINSSGVVSGVTAGTTMITYLLGDCYAVKEIYVFPLPAAIGGTLWVCEGSTRTLTNATSGGTWTSSNTTTAPIGPSTGIVTGGVAGSATITYTLPTGCYVTASIVVYPIPAAITGPGSVCVGASITLSDATSGGTWSSSNT